jgi:hypothetical protein
LQHEFDAIPLFDISYRSSTYRVFLLPGNLQVDVSFTAIAEFGALGPKFRLLFGNAVDRRRDSPPSPDHVFGLGVHHVVRARICIERGRLWQAEYWISAARDEALTLACLRRGLATSYGRGFDDLPSEVLESFSQTFPGQLGRVQLLDALGRTVDGLLRNSLGVREHASWLERHLRELGSMTTENRRETA